jgi:DNA-binding response OmpR family regulator
VKGLQAGGDDYLVKPVSIAEILDRIAAIIAAKPAKADAPS